MVLREGEPGINTPDHVFAEMSPGNSVLTLRLDWKGEGDTLLPFAQKSNYDRV